MFRLSARNQHCRGVISRKRAFARQLAMTGDSGAEHSTSLRTAQKPQTNTRSPEGASAGNINSTARGSKIEQSSSPFLSVLPLLQSQFDLSLISSHHFEVLHPEEGKAPTASRVCTLILPRARTESIIAAWLVCSSIVIAVILNRFDP
jgi:hypothetical protein